MAFRMRDHASSLLFSCEEPLFPHLAALAADRLVASTEMTKAQVTEILLQNCPHDSPTVEVIHGDAVRARNTGKVRRKNELLRQKCLMQRCPDNTSKILLWSAKGSSSWLTTLPLKHHGLWLSKRDFHDTLALRYDWMLENTPLR